MSDLPELTPEERGVYEWQMWVPGVGEEVGVCGTALVDRRAGEHGDHAGSEGADLTA